MGFSSHVAPVRGRQDNKWQGKPADLLRNQLSAVARSAYNKLANRYTSIQTDTNRVIYVADSARAQQQEGRAAKGSKCAKNKRISI
jgi:hypothetical protein